MEFRIDRVDIEGHRNLKPNELLPLEAFELMLLLINRLPKSKCRIELIKQLCKDIESSLLLTFIGALKFEFQKLAEQEANHE